MASIEGRAEKIYNYIGPYRLDEVSWHFLIPYYF